MTRTSSPGTRASDSEGVIGTEPVHEVVLVSEPWPQAAAASGNTGQSAGAVVKLPWHVNVGIHEEPAQTEVAGQVTPQLPQLRLSLAVLMQLPLHAVVPVGHTHVLFTQV